MNGTASSTQPANSGRKIKYLPYALILSGLLAASFLLGRKSVEGTSFDSVSTEGNSSKTGIIKLKQGPWGDLESFPITIAAPAEILKVRGNENSLKWFFRGYSRENLAAFLNGLDMPSDQRRRLLDPGILKVTAKGVEMTPPREVVFDLSPAARQGIYGILGDFNENDPFRDVFLNEDLDTFRKSGVSERTISLIRKASHPSGRYLICYCMAYILTEIPTYEEKVGVVRAFTQQKTMLLRLRITPQTDINALTAYWGKAFLTANVRTLLESIQKTRDGGDISVISLLPPMPKSLLYTYPLPQNALNGPIVHKDCHWTSFNFFRDPPDPHFGETSFIAEKLKTDYYPIQSDPMYGDVICFAKPNGTIIHSAVYIADNVAYTKNGENLWHPWMYSNIPDLIDIYSAGLAPGQNLTLTYFRNKYY